MHSVSESLTTGTGVSAYIGAAAFIADKTYLTVSLRILSTEVRHTSYVQAAVNGLAPWSGPFDVRASVHQLH